MLKSALDAGDRVRAENALDFLRVAAGYGFAPEDVEYLYIKEGIPSAPVARERKELDAFLRLKRYMYYSLLRHEPSELLTGYDVSFPECHASTVLPPAMRARTTWVSGCPRAKTARGGGRGESPR